MVRLRRLRPIHASATPLAMHSKNEVGSGTAVDAETVPDVRNDGAVERKVEAWLTVTLPINKLKKACSRPGMPVEFASVDPVHVAPPQAPAVKTLTKATVPIWPPQKVDPDAWLNTKVRALNAAPFQLTVTFENGFTTALAS